jgi:plastocyanin
VRARIGRCLSESAKRARCAALLAALLALAGAGAGRAATIDLRARAADGTALADAVVAAYPLDFTPAPEPSAAVMDQRDRRFTPQVLAVRRGAEVTFPNSDKVSHHVYSFSPANRFEIFLARGEAPKSMRFDRPGIVTLGCNLHDWMLGYIAVVDTPYFGVTDEQGSARLERLPAGRYRVEVWHPRATDAKEKLERRAELESEGADFAWELRLEKPLLPARDQMPGLTGY